jgi:hypothetical protein
MYVYYISDITKTEIGKLIRYGDVAACLHYGFNRQPFVKGDNKCPEIAVSDPHDISTVPAASDVFPQQRTVNAIHDYLKELLQIAQEVVNAAKEKVSSDPRLQGTAALTDLFRSVKNKQASVIAERVVNDIKEIVRQFRFPGWPAISPGELQVNQSLRRALLTYQFHRDNELFDKADDYLRTHCAI